MKKTSIKLSALFLALAITMFNWQYTLSTETNASNIDIGLVQTASAAIDCEDDACDPGMWWFDDTCNAKGINTGCDMIGNGECITYACD